MLRGSPWLSPPALGLLVHPSQLLAPANTATSLVHAGRCELIGPPLQVRSGVVRADVAPTGFLSGSILWRCALLNIAGKAMPKRPLCSLKHIALFRYALINIASPPPASPEATWNHALTIPQPIIWYWLVTARDVIIEI